MKEVKNCLRLLYVIFIGVFTGLIHASQVGMPADANRADGNVNCEQVQDLVERLPPGLEPYQQFIGNVPMPLERNLGENDLYVWYMSQLNNQEDSFRLELCKTLNMSQDDFTRRATAIQNGSGVQLFNKKSKNDDFAELVALCDIETESKKERDAQQIHFNQELSVLFARLKCGQVKCLDMIEDARPYLRNIGANIGICPSFFTCDFEEQLEYIVTQVIHHRFGDEFIELVIKDALAQASLAELQKQKIDSIKANFRKFATRRRRLIKLLVFDHDIATRANVDYLAECADIARAWNAEVEDFAEPQLIEDWLIGMPKIGEFEPIAEFEVVDENAGGAVGEKIVATSDVLTLDVDAGIGKTPRSDDTVSSRN